MGRSRFGRPGIHLDRNSIRLYILAGRLALLETPIGVVLILRSIAKAPGLRGLKLYCPIFAVTRE
jgi:hypothetical protein